MALVLADRVRETTSSTGTAAFGLAGAVTGFKTFLLAPMANGDTTYYAAWNGGTEWEVGLGTYVSAGNTLARTTLIASSTGSAVSFTAPPVVWMDFPASLASKVAGMGKGLLGSIHTNIGVTSVGTSFNIASGSCAMDSTGTDLMALASAFTKTTSTWAAGSAAGGLDTGSIANSTWYHIFLIKNPTTQAVDVLFSLSKTAPTMPTGFTLFRRIGSLKTNGSGNWYKVTQFSNMFFWDAPFGDLDNASYTGGLLILNVPLGISTRVFIRGFFNSGNLGDQALVQSPLLTTETLNTPRGNFTNYNPVVSRPVMLNFDVVMSDLSSQIRLVLGGTYDCAIVTYGWEDPELV